MEQVVNNYRKSGMRVVLAFMVGVGMLEILSCKGLDESETPKVVEHQYANDSTLSIQIDNIFYMLSFFENVERQTDALDNCKMIGYYSGTDSLRNYHQFEDGKLVQIYNYGEHLICDYIINGKGHLSDFHAYGRFLGLETDTCLLSFKGETYLKEDDYGMSQAVLAGEIQHFAFQGDSLFLMSKCISADSAIFEYTQFYPNGNPKRVKTTNLSKGETIKETYYKENGKQLSQIEQKLMESNYRTCVFRTGLVVNDNDLFMGLFADDDVSNGMAVYFYTNDKYLRYAVPKHVYKYKISDSTIHLTNGGKIRSFDIVTDKVEESSRNLEITIDENGLDIHGDAPEYVGSTNYKYVVNDYYNSSYKNYKQYLDGGVKYIRFR